MLWRCACKLNNAMVSKSAASFTVMVSWITCASAAIPLNSHRSSGTPEQFQVPSMALWWEIMYREKKIVYYYTCYFLCLSWCSKTKNYAFDWYVTIAISSLIFCLTNFLCLLRLWMCFLRMWLCRLRLWMCLLRMLLSPEYVTVAWVCDCRLSIWLYRLRLWMSHFPRMVCWKSGVTRALRLCGRVCLRRSSLPSRTPSSTLPPTSRYNKFRV